MTPKKERLEAIASALAERPFASARELARELSHLDVSERTLSRDIAGFFAALPVSRGSTARARAIVAAEAGIQQILDGRKGTLSLDRLLTLYVDLASPGRALDGKVSKVREGHQESDKDTEDPSAAAQRQEEVERLIADVDRS